MGDRFSGSFFTTLACFGEVTKSTGSVDFAASFLARWPTVAEEDFFPNNGMVDVMIAVIFIYLLVHVIGSAEKLPPVGLAQTSLQRVSSFLSHRSLIIQPAGMPAAYLCCLCIEYTHIRGKLAGIAP